MRASLIVDDGLLAEESRHSDEAYFALYVFTDGSARKFSVRETCAGRGFIAMKSIQNRDEVPMVETCGLVQTAEGREYFVGASRAPNNTAEMQALTEALFWLNSCVEHKGLPISSKVMATVDSLFVKVPTDEKFVAKENRALAILLCHMWKVINKKNATSHTMGTGAHW